MSVGTAYVEIVPVSTFPLPESPEAGNCRDCRTPRHVWNRLHWLYREWSGKCPDCHASDIRLDFRDKNQEN